MQNKSTLSQHVTAQAELRPLFAAVFANCSGLIYIKIPATVAAIASDAFEGCGWNLVIDRLEALVEE